MRAIHSNEDDFMSASKQNVGQNVAFMLVTPLVLFSFQVFMTALTGDNMLRIILAGVGVAGFGGLLCALLVSKFKRVKQIRSV